MSTMIQVRNVPAGLHRELMKRAKRRGLTLTRYVQDILEREVARPPAEDVFDMIESSPASRLGRPAADLIREERSERSDP
jgi:hypothetical protein